MKGKMPKNRKEIKKHFGGLIDDKTAELLEAYIKREPKIRLSEAVERKGSVLIEGVVIKVYPVRYFNKESRVGKVGSVQLEDDCVVRVVFWNDAASLIEVGDVVEGAKLRIRGYSREGEVHVNDPLDVTIEVTFTRISELTPKMRVNLKGWISGLGDPEEAREIFVSDERGDRIKILLENREIYFKADIGQYIEILNGHVEQDENGNLRIYVDRNSRVRFGE